MQLELNGLSYIIFTLLSVCLIFSVGFIMGCGDEGDPVTDMVTVDGDMTDTDEPTDTTDTPIVVDPPPEEPMVSFKDDILPILTESCALANCHVAGGQGGLNLSEYDTFKDGGGRGPAFDEGNGDGSLVVKYIKGIMQPQMPLGGGAPLNGEQIQLFVDWINEGAENN